ncbi:MAG: PQQ-dependent sugar dehydrogenase [Solimonas sp.]
MPSPRRLVPLLSLLFAVSAHAADDPAEGRALFAQNCLLCHSAGPELPGGAMGPDLAGVVDRPGAAQLGYAYSDALRNARVRWDRDALDRFLAAPATMISGTTMTAAVPDAAQRRKLIAFLATTRAGALPAEQDGGAAARLRAGDWDRDAPGRSHRVVAAELPAPYLTPSAGNGPRKAPRAAGALPQVPRGYTVGVWADGLDGPRRLRVAPNGDVFVAETGSGRIRVLRAADGAAAAQHGSVYAQGLDRPFGIAFYPAGDQPQWVYVAENNRVLRYAYGNGDLVAAGPPQVVVPRLSARTGGHSTRDLAFSADGRALYVSVGSGSNVAEGLPKKTPAQLAAWEQKNGLGAAWGDEEGRADVLVTDPEGKAPLRAYATGIRNCVGLALQPVTGALWCAVNERDGLGDDLVPDYVTRVREGAFYGWPWYYIGPHEDPRHAGERPDLRERTTVPDVLLQAHSAALGIVFVGEQAGPALPDDLRGDAFVALHGSWNRSKRTGYKVVHLTLRRSGEPEGDYTDFMTGFVNDDDSVWGRPVGVAIAHDGALLVSDDVGGRIWRVASAPR